MTPSPTDRRPVSRVFLKALTLQARIGYYAHERSAPQPLVIHVELTLDTPRFGDEDLAGTVDYTRIAAAARELAAHHIDLVETFAERLAARCLAFDHVMTARVRIEKPEAVPEGVAGVEIERWRE